MNHRPGNYTITEDYTYKDINLFMTSTTLLCLSFLVDINILLFINET